MNHKINNIVLAIALAGAGVMWCASNTSAISVNPDDIPNQTYVIGTHMFTREVTASYPGYITTSSIMLAAQTIDGDNLDDMKIYYKTVRGNWVNGLTNQEITKPDEFNIVYNNLLPPCNSDATSILDTGCMQDMNSNVRNTMVEDKKYTLKDTRDNKKYTVAKLADGNVWMVQNLAIGGDTPITLTPDNSDVALNFTLPTAQTSGTDFWDCADDESCTQVRLYSSNNVEYGNYYSWYTATANSGTYSMADESNAEHSVCPSGWRLPTGGEEGELMELLKSYHYNKYSGFSDKTWRERFLSVASLANAGTYNPHYIYTDVDGFEERGRRGSIWSSTKSGESMAYILNMRPSGSATFGGGVTYTGRTIRCIAR